MGLFSSGEDPRDTLISTLLSERDYLRAKVDELQKELLAMTSSSAYRLVHRDQAEPEPVEPVLSPMQLRDADPVKPEQTADEIKASWGDS